MEKRKETEKKCNHSVRKKWKRMIAVALSVLMVTSAIDYSGFINVNAQTRSDIKTISQTIDGIEITVKADAGVFPEDAMLKVKKIEDTNVQEKIEEAVKEEVEAEETAKMVENLISFDITITDADGNELQPDTSKGEVKVSFAKLPMVTEENAVVQELKVFHVDDSMNEAQGLETTVNQEAGTLEAPAEHFSVYTVAELTDEITANVEAEVKASDGTLTYYDTVEEAITAAQGLSGSTLTLLKDVETETYVTISSGTFAVDLDGNTWNCTYIYGMALNLQGSNGSQVAITFKDSAGDGRFTTDGSYSVYLMNGYASAVFEGGSYTGIYYRYDNVGDALGTGYVYRNNSDGSVVTDTSEYEIYDVTVMHAPVKITAQPENFNPSEATISISLTAETVPAESGNDITYQWYKEDGTAIDGATTAVYTLPEEPSARLDSYYCAVSCDAYTVNSHIVHGYEANVTDSVGAVTTYDTIEEAITAAMDKSGSTVTLLKDVETENYVTISSGTFTIDLNGKTLNNTYSSGTMALYLAGSAGNEVFITFKDSAGGGRITTVENYSVFLSFYASAVFEGGNYKGIMLYDVGKVGDLLAEGYAYKNSDNTWLTDTSGYQIFNVTVAPIPVKITTQPEDVVATPDYTEEPTFTVTAQTVPADSGETILYQWYKEDGTVIDGATNASYTVEPNLGEGTYAYYCAITCDGYTVNTQNATFYVTSITGNYTVTSAGGVTINYPTLETAIIAAKSKPNSTVKLLADATTDNMVEVDSGTFTIDLYGNTWTSTTSDTALYLGNGSHVTLMDSATDGKITTSTAHNTIMVRSASLTIEDGIYENESNNNTGFIINTELSGTVIIQGGTIQTSKVLAYLAYFQHVDVVISGGTFSGDSIFFQNCDNVALSGGSYSFISTSGVTVGTLLASGYGYKNVSNSTWVNRLANATSYANDLAHTFLQYPVSVEPVPVQITDQPHNATSTTYGYTEVPTMSVAAEKTAAAPSGIEISYQWYRVKSGSETSDTAVGTDSNTLEIPTGLDAGTHSFYCVVSCDGYIVNSESATVTVEKAVPTISLSVNTYKGAPFVYGNPTSVNAFVYGINGEKPDGTVTFKIGNDSFTTKNYDSALEKYSDGGYIFSAGTHIFTAIYKPSTDGTGKNYVGVTSAAVEQTIDKADQSISITAVDGKKYKDADFTLETTGEKGTGAVTFSVPEGNGVLSISQKEDGRFDAAIIGAGEVTVAAIKAADTNYNEATATQSITIEQADTSIAFQSSYTGNYFYTGSPISNPAEVDLSIAGASYSDVSFVWYDSNSNQLDTPPTATGNYILAVSIPETANTKPSANTKSVTISSYDGTVTFAYNGSTTLEAWYSADVSITADGYTVSDSPDGTYADSYLLSGEGEVSKTLYFKQNGTGYITDGKTITVNIDKTAPVFSADTDGIIISDNKWKGFLNNITFGHFFKENKNVSISATDSGSGENKYYYYIDTGSTTVKTAEELNSISFTEGSSFSITDESKYIIYAYAEDQAGNRSAYICTDGIVIDKTAPNVLLYELFAGDIKDISAVSTAGINELGTISYIVKATEQGGITAQAILDDPDKKTVSRTGDFPYVNLYYTNLTASTIYYVYAVGTDRAGNNGNVVSSSFTTHKTLPAFTADPTITGTYGQQVKDMTVSQVASTNGVAGGWSVSSTDKPSVGTSATYDVVFTPDNAAQYATVTVPVSPTVNPKSLTATDVTIEEVSGTYTYDGAAKVPTVTVTDSAAIITSQDYEYSYSNNISAGPATLTVTGKGNYTGSVNRTFTIAKALAPSISYPTAGELTYGQKLSESILSESSNQYGTFTWSNENTVPTVTNSGYEMTFTPNENTTANYEDISNRTESVSINVSKATPAVAVNTVISDDDGKRKAVLTAIVTGVANVETPTGTVKFIDSTNGSDIDLVGATEVTITDGKAVYTWTGLANQVYKVKAVYNSTGNYTNATSTELSFDTTKQNQDSLTIGTVGTKTYGDEAFTLSTIGGSGNGAVSFTSSNPDIVSISGTTATIHKAGIVTITATKAADDTYTHVDATINLTIGRKVLHIGTGDEMTLFQNSYTYDGLAREPGVTVKLEGKTLTEGTDYTVTYLDNINVGTASVTVMGQGNYEGSASTTFTIDKANQNTLNITEVTGKKYLDSAFTLTSTGGSGTGEVTYSVPDNNDVLSISGSTATIIGSGTVTVTAVKVGDNNYTTTTATYEIMIAKASAPSITFPTASSITYGQRLFASILSGGSTQYGSFAWTNNNTVPNVSNSGYEVVFTPNANTQANYETITGTTDTVAITVSKATPAVTVNAAVSDDQGSRIRKAVLTVTVTGAFDGEVPTGTVTFINTTSGSDANIEGATEVTLTEGEAIYTWTGLANQIYKVKGVYSGSGNYNNFASTEISFDTNKQNQEALNIGNIGTKTYGDEVFTLSTTGGSGNGAVSFISSHPDIVSISGTTATIHKAGSVTLTATKAATDIYNETKASVSLTVHKKALTVKADNKLNIIMGAPMPDLTYTVTGLVGNDSFTNPIISTTAANTGTVGEYDILISDGTLTNADSYTVTYTNGKMTTKKVRMESAVITGIMDQRYTGMAMNQSGLSVQINGETLKNGTDYTVSYKNNIIIGSAAVIIIGKGIYTGTIEKNFQINVSKGADYTISNRKYKVTDAKTNGTGTVTLIGLTKSKSVLKGTLKIGDTVTIGGKSFRITAIGDKALKGYTKLTKVTIGNNVSIIGKEAFSGCGKVASVTVGTGLKTISTKAFYNCKKLKTITMNSKQLKTVRKNAIKNIYSKAVIKVLSSKVSAYKKVFKRNTGFTNRMKLKKK